ncbi:uncharacterized protein LOC123553603 [Mercenaria mercenaria]|uniref:uncharacterized protein LOC123553603 n=1 Tax=Mercenaria mercenaria TaxID=6596 RepID=UPI00234EF5A3|nr:uncharacterized protein LOC123553603 [Mercenaria mercenaria]
MWLISKNQFFIVYFLLLKPTCFSTITMDVHYCGFEQKCAGNRTDVKLKTDSCCGPCECADICIEKNTCCKDKKRLDDNKHVMTQQCIPASYSQESIQVDRSTPFYFARTRCPDEFIDLNLKEKCEGRKPKSLKEITLVSSEDRSIIYKNKFCGLCHGDNKTKAWEIVAHKSPNCRTITSKQNINLTFITEHILSYCTLTFVKPSDVDLRSVMCFDKSLVINHCNQTGEWEIYDSNLESLCLNPPESVYYMDKSDSNPVFANLYCFLCNMKASRVPQRCSGNYGRLPTEPLFTLIDLNRWTEPASLQENKCRTDQILDTFLDRCKDLYCPRFALPVNGQCIPFLNVEQCYILNVKLVPLQSINNSESVKNELKNKLVHVQRKLGFKECESCFRSAYLAKDNNIHALQEMYIRYALEHTDKCKTENLWSKLTFIEKHGTHIKLVLNKKEINFDVLWDNKTLVINDHLELIDTFGSLRECRPIQLERGSTCPKIQLSMVEYEAVLKNHSKVHDLWFVPNKGDKNDTISVCLDSYILEHQTAGVKQYVSVTKTIIATAVAMLLYDT